MKFIIEEVEKQQFINEIEEKAIHYINEELGIANDVVLMTSDVYNKIFEHIKSTSSLPFNSNDIMFKQGSFDYNFSNYNFRVVWSYYFYRDKETYNKKPRNRNAKYNASSNTINITLISINNWIDKNNIKEAIQHEIEHYFECFKRGFKPYKNNELYQYSIQLMNDSDPVLQSVGDIIYLSFDYEKRAYANGLYQILYQNRCIEFDRNILAKTQLYNAVLKLKKDINILKGIDKISDKAQIVLDDIKMSLEDLIKKADETINDIIKKIGRTIVKVKKDLLKENKLQIFDDFYPNGNPFNIFLIK